MKPVFHIVPRARKYWIEAVDENGVRKVMEGFQTEEAALRRLKVLRQPVEITGRWDRYVPPKKPF